jgi:general secretion pathway protein J
VLEASYKSYKIKSKGFTLIEILVVMVILSLTTTLLSSGLSTTWRNFERLGARDLMVSSAQLPLSWFQQSLHAALLYHPDKPLVKGSANKFEFITFSAPDDPLHIPQKIVWQIEPLENGWGLFFSSQHSSKMILLKHFDGQPVFEYLHQSEWQRVFVPKKGILPQAVRINVNQYTWVMAKPGRPLKADVPASLQLFGEYEF